MVLVPFQRQAALFTVLGDKFSPNDPVTPFDFKEITSSLTQGYEFLASYHQGDDQSRSNFVKIYTHAIKNYVRNPKFSAMLSVASAFFILSQGNLVINKDVREKMTRIDEFSQMLQRYKTFIANYPVTTVVIDNGGDQNAWQRIQKLLPDTPSFLDPEHNIRGYTFSPHP